MAQRKQEFTTEWALYCEDDEGREREEDHGEDAAEDRDTARSERDLQASAQN